MDVSTQPGQIFMGTTGRLSSPRQNITGGGNLIGFSIRLKRPKLLQVLSFQEKCNLLKRQFLFIGLVLFLEEDHYVAEDFLHVLLLMEKEKHNKKYKVDILSLGTYLKKNTAKNNPKQVTINEVKWFCR